MNRMINIYLLNAIHVRNIITLVVLIHHLLECLKKLNLWDGMCPLENYLTFNFE